MAWQTITTVTQLRSAPITGTAEFQRTAIKEKSQNSSQTALQTTTSPTGCGARGRAVRVKQKQVKGINPNTDLSLSNTQHGHSLVFRYHLWNITAVHNSHCIIDPTEPTESYSMAFAKMHVYRITCARQCVTLSYRCQLVHRAVFTDTPTPTKHLLPESHRKFLSLHPLTCGCHPCRGSRDMDFGILSLHPPLGTSSYITCCHSGFELGVWPSPQLATSKVSTCFQHVEPNTLNVTSTQSNQWSVWVMLPR